MKLSVPKFGYSESVLLPGIITLGVLLRLFYFFQCRSLWLDESFVAVNITERGFLGLTRPLEYAQGAPIGFLWLEKLITLVWGSNEYSLRLVPLIGGVLGLVLMHHVLQRLRSEQMISLATHAFTLFLLAVAAQPVYYSNEVKQYSLDVLASVWVLLATLNIIHPALRKEAASRVAFSERYPLVVFAVSLAILVWFSHPIVFMIAGAFVTLTVAQWQQGKIRGQWWEMLGPVLAAFVPIVLSFGIQYFLFLKQLNNSSTLNQYWADSFLALPFSPSAIKNDVGIMLFNLQWYFALPNLLRCPLVVLLSVGIVQRWRVDGALRWLWLAPFLVLVTASVLGKYPYFGRFLLFLAPSVALLTSTGACVLLRLPRFLPRKFRSISYGVLRAGIAAFLLLVAGYRFAQSPMGEDHRETLAWIAERAQSSDQMFVYFPSSVALRYYDDDIHRFSLPKSRFVSARNALADTQVAETTNNIVRLAARDGHLWVLVGHLENPIIQSFEKSLANSVTVKEHFYRTRAAAFQVTVPKRQGYFDAFSKQADSIPPRRVK